MGQPSFLEEELSRARHILALDGSWYYESREVGNAEFKKRTNARALELAVSLFNAKNPGLPFQLNMGNLRDFDNALMLSGIVREEPPEQELNESAEQLYKLSSGELLGSANHFPFFGVTAEDLKVFDNLGLDTIVRGYVNLHQPVIENLFLAMNPDEVVSVLLATGDFKRYNRHFNSEYKDAFELIKTLNDFSYNYQSQIGKNNVPSLLKMRGSVNKRTTKIFENSRGDLQERLIALPELLLDAFYSSFCSPCIPTTDECPEDPNAYWMPLPTKQKKSSYIRMVLETLGAGFQREIESISHPGEMHIIQVDSEVPGHGFNPYALRCDCEGYQHRNYCRHVNEIIESIGGKPITPAKRKL